MSDEKIELDVTLRDRASAGLDDIADTVDQLEKADPEVEVTADTNKAERNLDDVADSVARLEKNDAVIKLRAEIDDLKAQTKDAQKALDAVSDKADDTNKHLDKIGGDGGLKTRGNAISDLTGPLGDASSAASDFAGVFDGLGDIAGDVAGKVGLSAAAMETAIGGIGIAVAAAAALWTYFSGKQEEARKKQEELVKGQKAINDALKEGNRAAAAQGLVDTYKDVFDAAKRAGVPIEEVTKFLTGQADELETVNAKHDEYTRKIAAANAARDEAGVASSRMVGNLVTERGAYDELVGKITAGRDAYVAANGTLAEQDQKLKAVTIALGTGTTAHKRYGDQAHDTGDDLDHAAKKADLLTTAIGDLTDELSNRRAIEDFQAAALIMLDNVNHKIKPTRDEVRALEDQIVAAGRAAGANPIEIQTTIEALDNRDIAKVQQTAQWWAAQAPPIKFSAAINFDDKSKRALAGFGATGPDGEALTITPTSSSVVNVNMPAGARGVDVVRQITGHARRAGRRYGSATVPVARR